VYAIKRVRVHMGTEVRQYLHVLVCRKRPPAQTKWHGRGEEAAPPAASETPCKLFQAVQGNTAGRCIKPQVTIQR